MKNILGLFIILFVFNSPNYSQLDTVKGSWPYPPFNSSQNINATFAEFRNTLSSDHFHNAIDIGEPDGNSCYPSLDGTVYSLARDGSNAFIRIVTKVGTKWKHLTYLHIKPNPSLSIGDTVKQSISVIGNVVNGMGHVHLIERELANNKDDYVTGINNLRKNGGITPYIDSWAPVIHSSSLKFFVNATSERLQANQLHGKVDIQVKIEEINGSSSGERNNGTYIAGYRVWNETKTEIIFEPDDAGVKYRFDWKPLNSYVHNAFVKNVATLSNPVYWLTNGDGANEINSTKVISDNYFNASLFPSGNYQLEIFSEDTRDNKSNKFFPIAIVDPKPKIPQVYTLLNDDGTNGLKIRWKSNDEPDIAGYRLYYSINSELTDWQLAADESQLINEINEYSISSTSEFIVPPANRVYFFALTALDSAGQESEMSDLFARSDLNGITSYSNALIVNAFPKKNAEGEKESHNYTASYFSALSETDSIAISSASNTTFLDEIFDITFLQDYDMVVWFTGDNTNHVTTIQIKEMYNLAQYLENGGNLFISGSKIGLDLDERMTGLPDTLFYHHYMKAKYVYVGNDLMKPAYGLQNGYFANVTLNFGEVSEEKYPDDIDPIYGSEILLNYNQMREDSISFRHAGVGYKGKFGSSDADGAMVYISFPLETVALLSEQQAFFESLLTYFDMITDLEETKTNQLPVNFSMSQNYPNPFNPSTILKYSIPVVDAYYASTTTVILKVYDILGREITTLVNKEQKPGSYKITFNAAGLPSGPYFARLTVGNFDKTISMLLIK